MTGGVVGRALELAAISEFLGFDPDGPRMLVIDGAAGIGKSTLWSAALDEAGRRQIRVVASRPTHPEQDLAFVGLGDLFEGLIGELGPSLIDHRRRALEVALLVREVEGRVDPRTIGIAVRDLLSVAASRAPLIVAVDDVQWLDGPSTSALAFALRRLDPGSRVRWVLARRTGAAVTAVTLDDTIGADAVRRLRLGPLSLAATGEVLHERLGRSLARPTLRRVHAASDGNPFYALEIVSALPAEIDPSAPLPTPAGLDDLLAARLAAVPDSAGDLLDVVATAGAPTVDLLDALQVRRAEIDTACAARLLERHGDTVRFAHPLLASTRYRRMPKRRRREIHRRLVGLTREPVALAQHVALATDGADTTAAAMIERAADEAGARGALAVAAELRAHAVRLTPPAARADLHRRSVLLARAHLANAAVGPARSVIDELLDRNRSGPRRAEALLLALTVPGRASDSRVVLEEAIRCAAGDLALECRARCQLGWDLRVLGDLAGALHHSVLALELAERLGDESLLAMTLAVLASNKLSAGSPDALPFADRAFELVIRIDDPATRAEVAETLVRAYGRTGRHELVRRLWMPYYEAEGVERDELRASIACWALAVVELVTGQFPRAEQLAREGLEMASLYGDTTNEPAYWLVIAIAAAHRGDLVVADHFAGLGLGRGGGPIPHRVGAFEAAFGITRLWSGDASTACQHFAAAERAHEDIGERDPSAPLFRADHVEALLAVGRAGAASELVDLWQRDAVAAGLDAVSAGVQRARGLVAAAAGDLDAAHNLLADAAARYRDVDDPFGAARSLLALGVVRRRSKQKRTSRHAFQESVELFEGCGSERWAARARAELGTLGGRTRETGLTPAERRVAELVAAGGTNREVAAALFIGERTVETHLTHVYAKLGVRSRTELARAMNDGG